MLKLDALPVAYPPLVAFAGLAEFGAIMANKNSLYVERRPEGGYAVRKPGSERASAVTPTQGQAIDRARELNPNAAVHVERVRNTSGGSPDKWRKP